MNDYTESSTLLAGTDPLQYVDNPRILNEWHFVMQNKSGSWTSKFGMEDPSGQYAINMTPENDYMWNMYNGLIGQNTYYFAIKYNSLMVV